MAAAVPWSALEAVIDRHYPKMGPQGGRRAFPLFVMLRIYCLQQWYQLSDPGAEEALYDIQSMRTFAGLELGRDAIPDETTILNFRHLLERHDLTKAIFAAVAEPLERRGAKNKRFGKVRAKVEHVFRVLKCQFGYRKLRYRGIRKNGAQVFSLLALANIYLARRTLIAA